MGSPFLVDAHVVNLAVRGSPVNPRMRAGVSALRRASRHGPRMLIRPLGRANSARP
jgi:hypothetical protein